jgi:hypothetical protein
VKPYKKVYIDNKAYENLLDHLNRNHSTDLRGQFIDLDLFYSDEWLLDSSVIENIWERKGNWEIYLVFAHIYDPLKLIKRKITKCFTLKKAELTANHMRRLAAKDQRGTLRVKKESFKYCDN